MRSGIRATVLASIRCEIRNEKSRVKSQYALNRARGCRRMFRKASVLVTCMCIFAGAAWAQDPNSTYGGFCPPGSTTAAGGGGYMCMCPDGSPAGISGCASGYSAQPQEVDDCGG